MDFELLTAGIAVIGGFVALVMGADRFVMGASALARNLGVSPLVIGLTIVGFGTSAPEMLVSGVAAWTGSPAICIGNAIGSNITNIALVLGVAAMVSPLSVHSRLVQREIPLLLATMAFAGAILLDGRLGRADGAALIIGMFLMIGFVVKEGLSSGESDDPVVEEFEGEIPDDMPTPVALSWLFAGLLVLVISSRGLVWGASTIARFFEVSDLVIGLTVVAFGTSLPELAASVIAAKRGEDDIALGNIVGSNMFNTLGVLGIPGLLAPGGFDPAVLERDFPAMIGITFLLLLLARKKDNVRYLGRPQGAILLLSFFAYLGMLHFHSF